MPPRGSPRLERARTSFSAVMSTGVVSPFSARSFSSFSFAFAIASLHFVSDIVRAPYAKSGDRSRAGAANERGEGAGGGGSGAAAGAET